MRPGLTPHDAGRYSRRVNLRIVAALACCSACAQTPDNPVANDPDAVRAGNSVFRLYCTPCHGIQGQGGRGPDLTLGIYNSGEKDSDLFRTISHGIAGTEMSGFADDIIEQDIWKIIAYLRAIARHDAAGVPGDRANGERLFWAKGGCGACHIVGARGGRLGPELTHIGRRRSREYLKDAILAPSKDIVPGWGTIEVVKRDGTKLTGVERGFDNFSAQLMDAAGNYYSFSRSEVTSIKRDARSLMPEDYGRLLTSAEIDDLLAYLVSLRNTEASR
jgi:cytochrome c oxidase cbb3-type subunit 3